MTALRQNVFDMVSVIPEDKLSAVLSYISNLLEQKTDVKEKSVEDEAYSALLNIIKPIPNLDEKKELAQYRQERYGL